MSLEELSFNVKDGKVFLPPDEVDKATMEQIKTMVDQPTTNHARFMPDCHKGSGCCVGFTNLIRNGIVPNYVGGDIGCGILSYNSGIVLREKKYKQIEETIRMMVPVGEKVHENPIVNNLDNIFIKSNQHLENLKKQYPELSDFCYDDDYFLELCKKIKCNKGHILNSIGTLGQGNHYFEINVNENNIAYFTVHSGSRYLGQKVCNYHQGVLSAKTKFKYDVYEKKCKEIKKKIKDKKERKKAEEDMEKQMNLDIEKNKNEPFLNQIEMKEYLVDMIFTQNYASENRKLMIQNVLGQLMFSGLNDFEGNYIETIHNYIDFDKMILRKGAVSAEEDEVCIISLNMRDGILICKGKGNEDWNYSSAHGCGRILDRKSTKCLTMREFEKEMKDVYSTSIKKETLDESPMAYRDVGLIKRCLNDSVVILEQLKPIINVKGF
jgi:RNA-splicing ligase RtcB